MSKDESVTCDCWQAEKDILLLVKCYTVYIRYNKLLQMVYKERIWKIETLFLTFMNP